MKAGWQKKTLGEVCDIINGGTPKTGIPLYWEGDLNWITPADLGKLKSPTVHESPRKISQLGLEKSSAKLFPANSVILSTRAPIGHLAINTQPMSTNQGCRGLVPGKHLDTWFLFYFLKANVELLDSLGTGATFKELSTKALSNVIIPLPPLSEQHRIVAILDEAFAAIDKAKANTEQNLRNAGELFESYLQGVFDKRGEGWEEKTLGEIATFRNGLNYTKSSKGEQISIVGVKDFRENMYVPLDELDQVVLNGQLNPLDELNDDDIIAVRSNGNPQLIGRTMLARGLTEKTSHSGFTIRIRLNPDAQVLAKYLVCFLRTTKTRQNLIKKGNGVGIKSLNQGSLATLHIPFPSSKVEQTIIVKKLENIQSHRQTLEGNYSRKLQDLNELKRIVLERAFSGQLMLEKSQTQVLEID